MCAQFWRPPPSNYLAAAMHYCMAANRAAKAGLDVNPDTSEYLCHYKWGYLDHDLGRWTTVDLDVIFLQILPAKMT